MRQIHVFIANRKGMCHPIVTKIKMQKNTYHDVPIVVLKAIHRTIVILKMWNDYVTSAINLDTMQTCVLKTMITGNAPTVFSWVMNKNDDTSRNYYNDVDPTTIQSNL